MTLEIAYVLLLLVGAVVLFARDVLPLDVAGIVLLLLLVLPPGILTPAEALAGFGSETIITLACLFVLTSGVTRTGVVERLGLRLASLARDHPTALMRMLLLACTTVSGFVSNTVTTAAMLPLALGSARRARVPASRVLMPLAFASILSGGVTLISTSTNLVVSGELPAHGLEPIGFFELAPLGVIITVLGMLYLLFVAPRLVPERDGGELPEASPGPPAAGMPRAVRRILRWRGDEPAAAPGAPPNGGEGGSVIERYGLRTYLSEVILSPGSPMAGRSLGESRIGEAIDLAVVGLRRGERKLLAPRPGEVLEEGDVLLVEGRAEDILAIKDSAGIEIKPDFRLSGPDLESENVRMVEAMVLPRSDLIGGTLQDVRFREVTGVTVLGIHALQGNGRRKPLSRRRLAVGDMLLLQGRKEDIERLDSDDLMLLQDRSGHHPRSPKAGIAAAVFVGAILLASTRLLPLSMALMAGIPVLILTRCLTTEEAYESVDWRLMVLIGSMMAFGTAMSKTGAAAFAADLLVEHLAPLGRHALLVGFFLLTLLLTQPMSNQAAALVLLPVAVQAAHATGMEPRPLVMAVVFAASCSFLTPLEPSCVLVWGPGRYRFLDFVRVGGLLTLIVFVVAVLLIPVYWPLEAAASP